VTVPRPASGPRRPIPVAILGATGAVGQTFVRLLAGHPWFRLVEVAASERSAGRPYREAATWLEGAMPSGVADLSVQPSDPSRVTAPLVFSALDAAAAGEIEPAFARAGRIVLSNARNFRMEADVPLLIPEVNAPHMSLIDGQRAARGWTGAILTNPNCAATVATMALAPLHAAFGVRQVVAVTLQAISGAGYPGVPSLDILGNVIPHIGGDEEEKIAREIPKMLGGLTHGRVEPAPITISAHTNRVPVEHGHTVCLTIGCDRRPAPEEAIEVLRAWRGCGAARGLPSAPDPPLAVRLEPDRPQPRRDVTSGGGMRVEVGRVRGDDVMDLRLVAMGHNTVRGAAGGSVLNAELLVAGGVIGGA
jgi:aspartate-semialdehyde dehydrogenase